VAVRFRNGTKRDVTSDGWSSLGVWCVLEDFRRLRIAEGDIGVSGE
jgi:hypothetical protein